MDVSQRLIRLMRSIAEDKFESISSFIEEGSELLDERLRAWEKKFDFDEEASKETGDQTGWQKESSTAEQSQRTQLEEDLQLFGLVPPSSLDEVRQVRNRELKKFHPDKYQDQPEKLETAKRIVQIYNTAYDRLKKHYNSA